MMKIADKKHSEAIARQIPRPNCTHGLCGAKALAPCERHKSADRPNAPIENRKAATA